MQNVSMSLLSKYMDNLYEEDYETKIAAARSILLLQTDPYNLEELIFNEPLVDLLSRTLKEEFKKNMELSINIMMFFFYYSNYKDYHTVLLKNNLGDISIKIIEYHYAKFYIRKQDLENELKSGSTATTGKMVERYKLMVLKQDRILKIAFNTLLNLSFSDKVEKKMIERNIVEFLILHLHRHENVNLIVIQLLMLKKLSVYEVNKLEMVKHNISLHLERSSSN